ncbi:hypothetical protein EV127DRAFT_422072 [Xylaria flabelliformis]|nr:hypothetical protein EV127DRAFT_422072 [Xylaria flabelliformis]
MKIRQTARVECESLYLDDAEVMIVVDVDAKYRLINQVLIEDFFTPPSNRPSYTGSTCLVQKDDTGERKIFHYKNKFINLSPNTLQG